MKRFEIRVDPELFAQIEQLAHAERRTINGQIHIILQRGLLRQCSRCGARVKDGAPQYIVCGDTLCPHHESEQDGVRGG